jgi:ABC-2 type transport system ATP-binding protein
LQFLVKSPTLNLGVILSSQQLHEVEKVADKVLLIKDGNCFWNNDLMTESDIGELVVELETTTDRTHLAAILPPSIAIAFNGNFYTLSGHFTAKELLATLSEKNVDVLYFRNITHSTKRFF